MCIRLWHYVMKYELCACVFEWSCKTHHVHMRVCELGCFTVYAFVAKYCWEIAVNTFESSIRRCVAHTGTHVRTHVHTWRPAGVGVPWACRRSRLPMLCFLPLSGSAPHTHAHTQTYTHAVDAIDVIIVCYFFLFPLWVRSILIHFPNTHKRQAKDINLRWVFRVWLTSKYS